MHFGPERSESSHGPKRRSESGFCVLPRTGLLNIAGPWEVMGHANDILGRPAYELAAVGPRAPVDRDPPRSDRGRHPAAAPRRRRLPDVAIVAGAPGAAAARRAGAAGVVAAPLSRAHPHGGLDLHRRLRARRRRRARRQARHHALDVPRRAAVAIPRGARRRRGHLRQGRARLDVGGHHRRASISTLALVEEDHGHRVAMAVARRLVLFLRRSGNQAQFSSALQRQESEPPKLHDIAAFVLEHVDQPLPVDAPRARRRHEPAHAQPLVPRAPRRITG